MRKTAIHSPTRSGDEVTLLLAEARNNERLRCARRRLISITRRWSCTDGR